MSEIGNLVQETIDFGGRNVPTRAFSTACQAFNETAKKHFGEENLTEKEIEHFVKENWWLISFMGFPQALPVSDEILEEARNKILKKGHAIQIEEIVSFIISKNLVTNGLPIGIEFDVSYRFDFRQDRVYIPQKLIYGLLGVSIFHPLNKDETLDENYWFEFGGFRMFVSELWGRQDLVERAINLH